MNDQESKKQILKSTGVLGSVQVINILIGIGKVKILAILLGPIGVGIAGIYQTTITFLSAATGFGLNFSGVRDIAISAASNDKEKITRTALVLKRWTYFTGVLGMVICIVSSHIISKFSFGNSSHSNGLIWASAALVLYAITGGMLAMLQGLRQIVAVAKANVIAAFISLVGSSFIYFIWGIDGIVPSLIFTYGAGLLAAWYFSGKIKFQPVTLSWRDTYHQGKDMARVGFFMVVSSLMGHGMMYLVRAFIVQQSGLVSVGHFIAAWTIASMYTSAIFSAMGSDFYPRLSGVQHDNQAIIKLVNEQTEVALLVVTPIIIGMLSFIGVIVKAFYSNEFGPTVEILNWQLLGDFFKVLSWPLSFIFLAMAKGRMFMLTELIWNVLFLVLILSGWSFFGIKISGIAFMVSYFVYLVLAFVLARRLVGFYWSATVLRYAALLFLLVILSFLGYFIFSKSMQQHIYGSFVTILAAAFSFTQLKKIIDFTAILTKLKLKFGSS